jgi:large subunit ribosomal protein L18
MAVKIRRRTSDRTKVRAKRKQRIRNSLYGTPERPRVAVFRSNQNIYAQLVDDLEGKVLMSCSTLDKGLRDKVKNNVKGAQEVGKALGKLAQENKIDRIVFDRSGYLYHGRVKAVGEGLRESGLEF